MMSATTHNISDCKTEEITAYLDGELDAAVRARLEEHLAACQSCSVELETQRWLLGELDVALMDDASVEMPVNFAQVVAVRAQADLSGVRERRERRRALRLCAVLAALAVSLLGGAAVSETIFAPLRTLWRGCAALISFLGHALYDAGTGLAVITRGIGGYLVFESRAASILVLLLFVSSLFMLRRLIARYHRSQITE